MSSINSDVKHLCHHAGAHFLCWKMNGNLLDVMETFLNQMVQMEQICWDAKFSSDNCQFNVFHGGMLISFAASQLRGSRFDPDHGLLSVPVSMWSFLQVLWFSLISQNHPRCECGTVHTWHYECISCDQISYIISLEERLSRTFTTSVFCWIPVRTV